MVYESASSKSSAKDAPKEAVALFGGIKIKQEKITPPSSPKSSSLNGTYITPVDAGIDDKSQIGPIKSSTQILGELFQAFDAKVPEGLNKVHSSSSSRKKHKKEKKSKKSSRHKRSHSEEAGEPSIAADNLDKDKKKHRRVEKERRRLEANKPSPDDLLAAKLLERKRRFESDNGSVKGISKITKTEKPSESITGGPTAKILPAKIVFKNLKESEILRKSESSIYKNQDNDNLSDLSLSDEETYMREKNSFYHNEERYENPFYANKSKVQDDEPM